MGGIAPPLEENFFALGNKSDGSQVGPPLTSQYDTAVAPEVNRTVSAMSQDIKNSLDLGINASEVRQKQVTDAIPKNELWEQPKDIQEGYFEFLRLRWGHDPDTGKKWDYLSHFGDYIPGDKTDHEIRASRSHILNPKATPQKTTYLRVTQSKNDSYKSTFTTQDPPSNEAPMFRNRGRCKCYNAHKVAPDGWMEWQRAFDFLGAGKKFIFLDTETTANFGTTPPIYTIYLIRWDKYYNSPRQLLADNPCTFEYKVDPRNGTVTNFDSNATPYIMCTFQPSVDLQNAINLKNDPRLTDSPVWLFCNDQMLTRAYLYMYTT